MGKEQNMETIKSAPSEQEIQIQLSGTELIEHIADSRNYTKLKNVYIDERATTFGKLSDISYIVGLYLIRTSWENQICNQSTQQIAHVLGKEHTTSITRALNELEKQGFVKLHKRKEQLENGRFASLPTIIDVSPLYRIINERQKKWAEQFGNQPKCKIASRSLSAPDLDATPFLDDSPKCKFASRLESNNDAPSNDQEIDENQPTEMQNRTPIINNLITESSSDDDCGKNVENLEPAVEDTVNAQHTGSQSCNEVNSPPAGNDYYMTIDDKLASLGVRMSPSSVDGQLMKKLHTAGVELDLVLSTMDDVFEKNKASPNAGKIKSFNYFTDAIWEAHKKVKQREEIDDKYKSAAENTRKRIAKVKKMMEARNA